MRLRRTESWKGRTRAPLPPHVAAFTYVTRSPTAPATTPAPPAPAVPNVTAFPRKIEMVTLVELLRLLHNRSASGPPPPPPRRAAGAASTSVATSPTATAGAGDSRSADRTDPDRAANAARTTRPPDPVASRNRIAGDRSPTLVFATRLPNEPPPPPPPFPWHHCRRRSHPHRPHRRKVTDGDAEDEYGIPPPTSAAALRHPSPPGTSGVTTCRDILAGNEDPKVAPSAVSTHATRGTNAAIAPGAGRTSAEPSGTAQTKARGTSKASDLGQPCPAPAELRRPPTPPPWRNKTT